MAEENMDRVRRSAVEAAWRNEKTLVLMGQGTRDWTPEEQRELIETGRVSGYEGHHMQSVKYHPENAGNPDNIQFLTREEHFYGAHQGNYKNETNGAYNVKEGKMQPFEDGELVPQEHIRLSEPTYEYVDTAELMRQTQIEEYNEMIDAKLAEYRAEIEKNPTLSREEKESLTAEMEKQAETAKAEYQASLLTENTEETTAEETAQQEGETEKEAEHTTKTAETESALVGETGGTGEESENSTGNAVGTGSGSSTETRTSAENETSTVNETGPDSGGSEEGQDDGMEQ